MHTWHIGLRPPVWGALALLLAAACSPTVRREPDWLEVTDYCPITRPRDGTSSFDRAKAVALSHARENLFRKLLEERAESGVRFGYLVAHFPALATDLARMVEKAAPAEVRRHESLPAVIVTLRIDKHQARRLAVHYEQQLSPAGPAKTAATDSPSIPETSSPSVLSQPETDSDLPTSVTKPPILRDGEPN